MSQSYAVVTFIDDAADNSDEEMTSEVPSSWVTKDELHCWWPSSKNVTALITKKVQPDPRDRKWQLRKIHLDGYYADLDAARKKAQTLSSSSDENDQETRGRGRRMTKTIRESRRIETNSDSSQDMPTEKSRATLPRPPDITFEIEDNDEITNLISMGTPMTFADTIIESHLETTSDISTASQSQSSAATNGVVVFDALLSSTSDRTSSMMTVLTTPSRVLTNRQLPTDSADPPTSTATLVNTSLPSSSYQGINESLPFDLLDKPGSSSAVHGTPALVTTPSRQQSGLIHRPAGNGTRTSTLSSKAPAPASSTTKSMEEKIEKILKGVAETIVELKKFNERLEKLENQVGVPLSTIQKSNNPCELSVLPFQTVEQIQAFEADLKNKETHPDLESKFLNYLIRVGGTCLKSNAVRVFSTVFSNKVPTKSSWKGLRNNFQISDLTIISLISDAISVKYPHTKMQFQEIGSEWFRQGNQRFKRERGEAQD